jgi:acyl carrier protein
MLTLLNADLNRIVTEAFQRYLGTSESLPLSSRLFEDLGIDSLGFVTILLELAEQLRLDLAANNINLSEIQSIEDVVLLVRTLLPLR